MLKKVVVATGNEGKVQELAHRLAHLPVEWVTQSTLAVSEAEETGLTFVENALIKARNAAKQTGLPALADDSGLEVDALNGEPGIYSSRYAGAEAGDDDNNRKLLAALDGLPDDRRSARFQCMIVFLRHWRDPNPVICQGTWEGRITTAPQGEAGFGYDPLFYVPEKACTAAQLSADIKNQISHRGQALSALIAEPRLQRFLGG